MRSVILRSVGVLVLLAVFVEETTHGAQPPEAEPPKGAPPYRALPRPDDGANMVLTAEKLPNGPHTVELTLRGDGPVTVDAFDVFEPPLK